MLSDGVDRYELERELARAGFREYRIEGVHEPRWLPSAFPYLREEAGRWVVGICERGTYTAIRGFDNEDAACRSFRDLLERGTPPPPPTAFPGEDMPALIDELRRWRRAAWEAYRRARAARRNRDDGPGAGPSR